MRRRTALTVGATATGLAALSCVAWQFEGEGEDKPERHGWHRPGADDAVTINEKLASASAGDEIELPFSSRGYVIATPIRIPSGVALLCDPRSPIRAKVDLVSMVSLTGPRGRLQGAALESGSVRVTAMVVVDSSAHNVAVDKCDLRAGERTLIGVRAHGQQVGTSVTECAIAGPDTAVSFVGSGRGLVVSRTRISRWSQRGIYFQQRGNRAFVDVTVRGNTVEKLRPGGVSRYPIVVTGTESQKTRRLEVGGNMVVGADRSYRDPEFPGTADQIAVRHAITVEVSGNKSSDGGDVGITVAHCRNGEIRDNEVSRNDTAGIYVGTRDGFSMGEILVEGNRCANNGQNRQGDRQVHGRAGIRVAEGGRVVLRDNVVVDDQVRPTQLSGVTLDGTPNVRMDGNDFRGVKTDVVKKRR